MPIDEHVPKSISCSLVIYSSTSVREECKIKVQHIEAEEELIAGRTLRPDRIGSLVNLDPEESILFVNDHKESAAECIEILREIGFTHLNFIPYSPPDLDSHSCSIAVTAGEPSLVPEDVELVCDLGSRIMDFPTLLQIASFLNIDKSSISNPNRDYFRQIVREAGRVKSLSLRLQDMVEGLSEAMISYRFSGEILVATEQVQRILMAQHNSIVGKRLQKVIHNRQLTSFLLMQNGEKRKIFTLFSREIVFMKIIHKETQTIVCRIKPLSEVEEDTYAIRELRKRGHYAKYKFEDIIGTSKAIIKTRLYAQKLAASSLTILLEGETGTGKELFASAIHKTSSRKEKPYIAVNLSSLNESLIESELFGYESGSFSGASKHGKSGLFEQADGGTLFLDEIGDISPRIQRGLLRVLQEGEVMRVGGKKIRKVDVRIIAATNKDLTLLAEKGEFRDDLLYRLRQGYVYIPPLRERDGDISLLLKHFLLEEGGGSIQADDSLISECNSYSWPGNIRELKNMISCMAAVSSSKTLTPSDIPEGVFQSRPAEGTSLTERELTVLSSIASLLQEGQLPARDKIAHHCSKNRLSLSASQVRSCIERLHKQGYLLRPKQRYGLQLTEKANNLLF